MRRAKAMACRLLSARTRASPARPSRSPGRAGIRRALARHEAAARRWASHASTCDPPARKCRRRRPRQPTGRCSRTPPRPACDEQTTSTPAHERHGAGDPMPRSQHLVRQGAQRGIGAPRSMEELPQLHGASEQGGEQPGDQPPHAKRAVPGRICGSTGQGTRSDRDRRLVGVRPPPAQIRRRSTWQCSTHGEHRRGHGERHGVRLDTERRQRSGEPAASGKRHDHSARDHSSSRRGQDPRIRLFTASLTEPIASSCAIERGGPGSAASKPEG